jgi:hypothetical protein
MVSWLMNRSGRISMHAARLMGAGIVLVCCVLLFAREAQSQDERAGHAPGFERDLYPILRDRCFKCPGAERSKGGLDLRTKTAMLQGGDNGPALVPGSAAKSLIFEKVHEGDMPPDPGPKLTAKQVELIRA